MENTNGHILEVENLRTYFPINKGLLKRTVGYLRAVDGISFSIRRSESFGLVGESGCGKTTTARSIMRLVPASGGRVMFEGCDVLSADKKRLKKVRRDMSMIFQDPYGSLNPRMTVADIVVEPMKVHKLSAPGEQLGRVRGLLEKVGLSGGYMNRYPHEFSGGQRQRIGLARALALEPKLVICDEPVSALDVSIQSQILNLLKDLQEQMGLTLLFIAHDLAIVEFFCDSVAVMYMGRIIEKAQSQQLYRNPLHPYTRLLMSAIPKAEPARRGKKRAKEGEVPSLLNPPKGCPFHPRCSEAQRICRSERPQLAEVESGSGHYVACWRAKK